MGLPSSFERGEVGGPERRRGVPDRPERVRKLCEEEERAA